MRALGLAAMAVTAAAMPGNAKLSGGGRGAVFYSRDGACFFTANADNMVRWYHNPAHRALLNDGVPCQRAPCSSGSFPANS
jgi:hypothetical protein